jgi:hypothetical protein
MVQRWPGSVCPRPAPTCQGPHRDVAMLDHRTNRLYLGVTTGLRQSTGGLLTGADKSASNSSLANLHMVSPSGFMVLPRQGPTRTASVTTRVGRYTMLKSTATPADRVWKGLRIVESGDFEQQ